MEDYNSSAKRHFKDAVILADNKAFDNAGYLIGLAVECALKQKCRISRPDIVRGNGHLPDLIHLAKRKVDNRRDIMLLKALNDELFKAWVIDIRYASTGNIDETQFVAWLNQAKIIFRLSGIKKDAK